MILITLECHELMGRDRTIRQPWSDVSVSFIREPGGIAERCEPTLVSHARLIEDRARAPRLESIVEAFKNGAAFYIEQTSPDDRNPEIYTSNAYIDQPEAERMLAHFLRTRGLADVGFQWVWPDFVCSVG